MQAELDCLGFLTTIVRIDKSAYSFILNGAIIKVYRKRESCNKRLVKIYNKQRKNKSTNGSNIQ